jgi:hypothetical protein
MSLPFQFANVTTLVTSQLDANYNALGALTPVPCSVSGTNAITLTPLANTPTVAAYSNYMQFTGIAAATNTTTITIGVSGLAALPGYKDTQAGPVALVANDIVQLCQFTAIYDSALNSGGGGFHVITEPSRFPSAGGTISGLMLFTGPVVNGAFGNTSLSNVVSASASIGWPNIPVATSTVSTIPVTGCSVGDCVLLGTPASVPVGIAFFGWVSTVGVVTIQASNMSGASLTPVAGTYRATAQRYTP